MAGYNSMPALSVTGGTGNDALGLGVSVNHSNAGNGLSLDAFDQDITFDESLLDNVNGLPLPFTPSYDFETFSTTFEDPFPYSAATTGRPYELTPHNPEGFLQSASPLEEGLDNKLLGFGAPVIKAAVVDDAGQFSEPTMAAELFGMFFLAEDVYSAENTGRPLELTCYRRNLWWCSGQITLPRHVTQIVTDQGRQVAVLELAASISAMESIEGKATEIICIPWKSTAANSAANTNNTQSEDAKVAGSPPNVPIDLSNGQELDNGCVSVPVSWKRLQFKHATANNGRRKGQQQHYVVQINLLGRIQTDGEGDKGDSEWAKIAEIQSGPVIVRGRSPRNFVSRRDVPLTGSSTVVDKKQLQQQQQQQQQLQQQPQLERQSLSSAGGLDATMHQTQHRSNSSGIDMTQNFQRYNLLGNMPPGDWTQQYAQAQVPQPQPQIQPQQSPHPAKKMALSPSQTRPPVPAWNNDMTPSRSNKAQQHQQQQTQQQQQQQQQQQHHQAQKLPQQQQQQQKLKRSSSAAVPLNLSLSEDERSPSNRIGTDPPSNSPPFANLGGSGGSGGTAGGSSTTSFALPTTSTSTASAPAGSNSAPAASAAQSDSFEDGELLYEYFPLSLDDWMPPVDAIYRPHVVHHTVVPPEVKAQQVRNKTKRYFAAE
ncbi:hypothetical protein SCUCBS95973_005886 [Sporothrix curviconia]|uniref:NDT80 domain-containing protein n=1 Tax=Sporothrix curviconia TaxID=1260050 RepID=A0ABP0C0M6_9PEZI